MTTEVPTPPPLTQMLPVAEYDGYQCPRCLRVLKAMTLVTKPAAPWCPCPEATNG